MIVDQCLLGADDRLFDRLELLSDVCTGSSAFDHPDDAAQMATRTVQPLYDRGMAVMPMLDGHS